MATTTASRLDAGLAQQPHRARLGRAAVEQDRGAVGVLDQRGVALPDVEKADGEAVRPRGRAQGQSGRPGGERGDDAGQRRPPPGRHAPQRAAELGEPSSVRPGSRAARGQQDGGRQQRRSVAASASGVRSGGAMPPPGSSANARASHVR